MKTLRCSDESLITIAQETADDLRANPSVSLQQRLADLERSPWPGLAMTPGQRRALRDMTQAICNGRADARTDPLPLASILSAWTAPEQSVA